MRSEKDENQSDSNGASQEESAPPQPQKPLAEESVQKGENGPDQTKED